MKLLVVEDDPGVVANLRDRVNSFGKRVNCLYSSEMESAHQQLLSHRFHCVSVDLYLPISKGTRVETGTSSERSAGSSLLTGPGVSRLSKRVIFTGDVSSDQRQFALDLAGRQNILYLTKGATEAADKYPPRANSHAWADCVAYMLGIDQREETDFPDKLLAQHHDFLLHRLRPYFQAYWQDAGEYLPMPLAREAAVVFNSIQKKSFKFEHLLAANRFRQWCLILARAQTSALAKAEGLRWPPGGLQPTSAVKPDDVDAHLLELEDAFRLEDLLPAAFWHAWPGWCSHLGGDQTAKESAGSTRLAFGHAAQALRQMRNGIAHSLASPRPPAFADIKPALLPLMDVAAYWADYPWFTHLRFDDGQWRGETPMGRTLAHAQPVNLPASMLVKPPRKGSRVHQVQWRRVAQDVMAGDEDSSKAWNFVPLLVDGWPWLRQMKVDNQDEHAQIVALWQPLRQDPRKGTEWQAYSFDGRPVKLWVLDEEFEPDY